MPKTCKKGKSLLKIRVFIATFNHSGLLPPLNMLVFFLKNQLEPKLHENSAFSMGMYGVCAKIAGTNMPQNVPPTYGPDHM